MSLLEQIAQVLQQGDDEQVDHLVAQAIEENIPAGEILDKALIGGMDVVGEQFRKHEIFLPEVLLAARAMHAGMERLRPLLIRDGVPGLGKVVIGTARGDLHDIGKNLVGIMLKGAGFEVIDLGKDVAAEKYIDTALAEGAPVIGMSALLTTTMLEMERLVGLLEERGLRERIKFIIGGAPVSQAYADEIGADAYAYDAARAVDCVKALVAEG